MSKLEEAWSNFSETLYGTGVIVLSQQSIRVAVRAMMLAAHVDACGNREATKVEGVVGIGRRCGHGWYCEGVKQIKELGK